MNKTKESWEDKFGKFIVSKGCELEKDELFINDTPENIEQFIKKTLQQQESKYFKVLRDIVGDYIISEKEFNAGYNEKRQEIIDIIKDNNIEL